MASNYRKSSRTITVSYAIITKLNKFLDSGKFSTYSDAVNTAVIELLGKISILESIESFDASLFNDYFKSAIEAEKNDKSKTEKISISLSNYVLDELDILAKTTGKNRSYILRLSIYDFFYKFDNNSSQVIEKPINDYPKTKEELEKFIVEIIGKIDRI